MPNNELTLVLSGHLCRPQSADLRPFWRGFIELQRKLPTSRKVGQIVVHSWNPELAGLARAVYAPHAECHEIQPCFHPEFLHSIDPPDRFELGLDRLNSTWKNVSLQSVLGNARSRAKVVQLMDELPEHGGQVLITRWDIGQSGTSQVNHLVMDSSLPDGYTYLSYFSEVDEGYADMWIVAPWQTARKFSSFDQFVLDCVSGKNEFLQEFCKTGWPRSYKRHYLEKIRWNSYGALVVSKIAKILGDSGAKSLKGNFLTKIKRRIFAPLLRYIERPPVTAENSYIPESIGAPQKYPEFLSLNIHAFLKYFMLSMGIRENIRFLTAEDFEVTEGCGQIINPQGFALLVWSSHEDEDAVKKMLGSNVLSITVLVQMGDDLKIWSRVESHEWEVQKVFEKIKQPHERLLFALRAVSKLLSEASPLLIVPSLSRYESCRDWFCLNALFKYVSWKRVGYVGFVDGLSGKPSLEFPGLHLTKGDGAFSLEMAVGTPEGIRSYLEVTNEGLSGVCRRVNQMMLEVPVLVERGGMF